MHEKAKGEVGKPRWAAADWLKAAAIAAVVVTHCGPDFFDPAFTKTDFFLRVTLTGFHVPTFVFVSGWLTASASSIAAAQLSRTLARVWVPYVTATLVVTALGYASRGDLAWNVATGAALGIFYYVPVWSLLMLSGWMWSRLGDVALRAVLLLVVVASITRTLLWPEADFFWAIRDPLGQGWLAYFIAGTCVGRMGWDRWLSGRVVALLPALLLCVPWLLIDPNGAEPLQFLLRLLTRLAYTAGVVTTVLVLARRAAPRRVQHVAAATLPVFLYHQPIAMFFAARFASLSPAPRILLAACFTMAITMTGVALLRQLLPSPARFVLLGDRI